ncbi:class I SAM-dependent methyltransferase, partial [Salmonella enterica subsp. enterica serovar Typhimurium]|uniref:class I SAM-dependent methyltransferase n=1 Tax=Salmonella enterica TaxID=28901 RepID=UPI00390C40CC
HGVVRLNIVNLLHIVNQRRCGLYPFLDPMFPHRQKSALVKKEMRVFQSLVGPDLDADGLLEPARQLATKRVVVKRPDYAPPLADVATPNAIVTKGHRFDIYAGTPLTE